MLTRLLRKTSHRFVQVFKSCLAGGEASFLLLLSQTLFAACTTERFASSGQPIEMKYASLLKMEEADSFTVVTVRNAWNPETDLATYVLVPSAQVLPQQLPEGTLVRTPLTRAVATTSVHASLLLDLQAEGMLVGLTDTAYVVSPTLKHFLRTQPGLYDMGTSLRPDVEKLRAAHADAVLVSPFENAGHGVLDRLGIPLIECADYMETSPLGRAEWMRFFGRLFGCAERADSLFMKVDKSYNALCNLVKADSSAAPTVFCDLRTGSTWYQPGGASTMGRFIADAGGKYLWDDRKESGSLTLDLESVFAKARTADVWLVKYGQTAPLTYAQMQTDCPQYASFEAWKRHHVWACNTLRSPFYEEVPFHPDRLLSNLIRILRPRVTLKATTDYYQPLEAAD